MPESAIEVLLVPGDSELEPGDWEWGSQVRSLTRRLQSHDIEVRERSTAGVVGEKGAAAEIILALGSSGAIAAAIGVVHGWLTQRSTRTVSLTVSGDGPTQAVELRANGLSDESARAVLVSAMRQRQLDGTAKPAESAGPAGNAETEPAAEQ